VALDSREKVRGPVAVARPEPVPVGAISLDTTVLTRQRSRRFGRLLGAGFGWYIVPAGLLLILTTIYPLVTMVRLAFSQVTVSNFDGSWPFAGTANFRAVFHNPQFWASVRLTLLFSAVLLVASLILGYIVAELIRRPGWLSNCTQGLLILAWSLPAVVSGTMWHFFLNDNGYVNGILHATLGIGPVPWLTSTRVAIWGVLLATVWGSVAFNAIVIKSGLLGVPSETIEAAAIDGAGRVKAALYVIIPQMRATFVTLALFLAIFGFGGSFGFIDIMTGGGPGTATQTVPFLSYEESFASLDFGVGAAIAVISMIFVGLLAAGLLRVRRGED
jgi:multiple sugar transport system permease protein